MDRERWRGLLDLTRPLNAVAAGALAYTGALVAGAPGDPRALAAALATLLATAGGNAINDYVDRAIDRQNRPDRPIPRGAVAPSTARRFAALLFAGAIAVALVLPIVAIAIAAVNLALLTTYTSWLKGRPGVGNAVVAWLTGSAFLFGAAAVGRPAAGAALAALAAGATFAREVVKDVEDAPGDRAAGLRTLPIVIGDRRSIGLAVGVLVLAVIASPIPVLRGTFADAALVGIAIADVVMLTGVGWAFRDPGRGQRVLKAGMFLAVLAFVAGRLVS